MGLFTWGDGVNDLYQQWSVHLYHESGWFYGSNHSSSNADVYVYEDFTDPTEISNAWMFPYSNTVVNAYEGDTVFFHGENGHYGAWVILNVYPSGLDHIPYAYLDILWYFVDDGTGDFTGGTTASAKSTWSQVKSLF